MYLEGFARQHGTIHEKEKEEKKHVKDMTSADVSKILATETYTPHHPNHIVLVVVDHIGILRPESTGGTTKQNIDKFSSSMRRARDVYGFSPVIIQQLNRNLSDVSRQKLGDLAPKLSDFADSSQTQQDADVIMALFDPYRHTTGDPGRDMGYDLKRLRDDKFRTFYRSLHILKNSFSSSGMSFPMSLQPVYGKLRTLPRKDDIYDGIYSEVLSGEYFRLDDIQKEEINIQRPFKGFGKMNDSM